MSRIAPLLLVVALVSNAAAREQEWHQVRSPHFLVLTDAGADRGRDVALRFEQMRHAFGSLLFRQEIHVPVPLLILGFRNGAELRQHMPRWQGKPVAASGLFVSSTDRDFILLDLSDPRAFEVVAHEYAHLLLASNLPAMPPWFDEGFAEYFSTIQVRKEQFEIGAEPSYVASALARSGLAPVQQLFAVQRDSPAYNESGDRGSAFYAQSWLLMSYLVEKHQLPAALEYCRLTLTQGVPPAEAIPRAFQLTPARLDHELATYRAARGRRVLTLPMPVGMDESGAYTYQVGKVLPLDVDAELGDLHLHSPDTLSQGINELENLLKQDPNHGPAHRSLGFAYLFQQHQPEKAESHIREAVQLTPNDPRARYYLAAFINSGGVMGGDFGAGAMREHLLKAVDLDPDYADAWSLLGFVYRIDQKFPQAANALLKAIRLSPRNDRYRLNLARVYADARRDDDAKALLAFLDTSRDPAIAAEARQLRAALDQAGSAPVRTKRFQERARPSTYDDPRWRLPADLARKQAEDESRDASSAPAEQKPDDRPILFLKGKLSSVTCDPSGRATLTVTSGKKKLQLATPDYKKLVLIGADAFSCSWSGLPVAVNYRASSRTTGDLVSVELQ